MKRGKQQCYNINLLLMRLIVSISACFKDFNYRQYNERDEGLRKHASHLTSAHIIWIVLYQPSQNISYIGPTVNVALLSYLTSMVQQPTNINITLSLVTLYKYNM